MNWLKKRPWILIILFFTAYVAAWVGLIIFAVDHAPPPFDPDKEFPKPSHHGS